MKRETGNNTSDDKKILSIRLTSSGLSFYTAASPFQICDDQQRFSFAQRNSGPEMAVRSIVDTTPALSGYFTAVHVFIDTTDTVFVPCDELDKENVVVVMAEAGIFLSPGEGIAVSPAVGDVCAVMKYDAKVLRYLSEYYGARLSFYSPLQENLEFADRTAFRSGFVMNLTERNMYITLFDSSGNLQLSRAYPYDNSADIIFYLYKLVEAAAVRNPQVKIFGPGARAAYRDVKRYFGGTSCAS